MNVIPKIYLLSISFDCRLPLDDDTTKFSFIHSLTSNSSRYLVRMRSARGKTLLLTTTITAIANHCASSIVSQPMDRR